LIGRLVAVVVGRDDRLNAALLELLPEDVAVIATVGIESLRLATNWLALERLVHHGYLHRGAPRTGILSA